MRYLGMNKKALIIVRYDTSQLQFIPHYHLILNMTFVLKTIYKFLHEHFIINVRSKSTTVAASYKCNQPVALMTKHVRKHPY